MKGKRRGGGRRARSASRSRMPKKKWCRFRKKCREGLDCTYEHPEEELQYFRELEEEEDQRYEDKPRYETPHKVPRPQKLQ